MATIVKSVKHVRDESGKVRLSRFPFTQALSLPVSQQPGSVCPAKIAHAQLARQVISKSLHEIGDEGMDLEEYIEFVIRVAAVSYGLYSYSLFSYGLP